MLCGGRNESAVAQKPKILEKCLHYKKLNH